MGIPFVKKSNNLHYMINMSKKIIGLVLAFVIIIGGIATVQIMAKKGQNSGKAPEINRNKKQIADDSYYEKGSGWAKVVNDISQFSDEEISLCNNLESLNATDRGETLASYDGRDEIWEQYKKYSMVVEGEYVVDLINTTFNSEKKTNLDEWKYNLGFSTPNYAKINTK
jgi:hypothetical protein